MKASVSELKRGARKGCIMFPLQCSYACSDERDEIGDGEDRKEWRLSGLLYADDLVLCGAP